MAPVLGLALAGLLILGGCPMDGTSGGSNPPDKTSLGELLNTAQSEAETTAEAENADAVPLGTYWASENTKDTFETAIFAAETIYNNANTTQAQINAALTTLQTALDVFRAAKQPGTAAPVDKSALAAKITTAENAKSAAVVSDDAANVAQGTYWVTQTVMTEFETAITGAKNAQNSASQTDVDNAVTALQSAITGFNEERKQGTKTSDFTQDALDALITAANQAKIGVEVSTNGDDVSPAKSWVSQAAQDTLNAAIAEAANADDSARDALYIALNTALNNFNQEKTSGTPPNKAALFAAIIAADQAKAGVQTATSAAQAAFGSKWASTAQWTPFNTAFTAAIAAANDSNTTKNGIDNALSALIAATGDFESAVSANGPGTLHNSIRITGLAAYNGKHINGGVIKNLDDLIPGKSTSPEELPNIGGDGEITNGEATILLYQDNSPWAGGGQLYAGFTIESVPNIFVSTAKIDFSATPNPVKDFTGFRKMTFSYTLGDIVPNLANMNVTLDQLFQTMTGKTYAQFTAESGITLYKDEALTRPFTGTDTVTNATIFYTEFPFDIESLEPDPHRKTGEISGKITLTDIPSPAPQVFISTYGYVNNGKYFESGDSEIRLSEVTGSSATLNWTIPLYAGDGFIEGKRCIVNFRLSVTSQSLNGDSSFVIDIPVEKIIYSGYADAGNIGLVSIKSVTLSGNLTVTYGGKPVPNVLIKARKAGEYVYCSTRTLSSPAAGAAWSLTIPTSNTASNVSLTISGYSANSINLFEEVYDERISVSDQNVSEITINLGDIPNPYAPLTENQWTNGNISSKDSGAANWYSMQVTSGTQYYLWWNDGYRSNGDKNLDVIIAAWYTDGTIIDYGDLGWHDPLSFVAASSGTVHIRVCPVLSGNTGDYAITYSATSARPEYNSN